MKVLIIGAAGMVGRKIAERLARDGHLGGRDVAGMVLADVIPPTIPENPQTTINSISLDITDRAAVEALISTKPDVVFHLAAIVSGEAELDFEKGYAINLDGTRLVFDATRAQHLLDPAYRPRVVFASSIAVFGSPFPDKISDDFFTTPKTSYGTQKAIGELLLSDYSRREIIDGIGIRLPTICIRPGAPNKAASGFFSNILREPLVGREAVLPVSEDVRHWHASPRSAVSFLIHAASIDTGKLGNRRNLNMPGLSATVGEQIEALGRVAGEGAVKLIRREHDPIIAQMVDGWAQDFDPQRALSLGFVADASFDAIIRSHIEDELGGTLPFAS